MTGRENFIVIWLLLVVAALGRTQLPPLLSATLEELSQGLETGAFTSVELVQAYIARIEETNALLHAVTELNPDAIAIAETLDVARRDGRLYGPLHGIPVLVKNNIATADGMNTTSGSYALLGAKVPADSTVAAKLRKAGVIILGKANLSQWADARSFNTSSGWSAHGGQTFGAYHRDQDPCGSSSGSGVGTSIGLSWAALGTETSGSIQCPACFNNVVGIKPTVGLTSRYLVVPISEHQDTVGPLARTVKDAAYLLNAIVGPDSNDNYTSAIPFVEGKIPDYVAACQVSALEGKRIGVPRHLIVFDDPSQGMPADVMEFLMSSFNSTIDVIQSAGAHIVDDIFLPGWEAYVKGRYMVTTARADVLSDLPKYLSKLTANPHNVTNLFEIREFTRSYKAEHWPERDTGIFDSALEMNMSNTSPLYWSNRTLGLHLAGEQGILGAMKNHSLDAILLRKLPLPAEHIHTSIFTISFPQNNFSQIQRTTATYFAMFPSAMIGSPAVTVPMGVYPPSTPVILNPFGNQVNIGPNIPFGVSFLGDLFSEEGLVGMAYAYEQRTKIRDTIKPYVQPNTELWDIVQERMVLSDEQEL